MTEGPALIHDGRSRIWGRFLVSGRVNAAPWLDAMARNQLVGNCECGGYFRPGKPYRLGLVDWYPMTCTQCPREPAAAGPKPKQKPNANRERR